MSEPNAGSDLAGLQTRAERARRPLRRQRPEGLDVVRDDRPEVLLLRAHRSDAAEAQGHLAADPRHGHAGHRHPAAAPHQRHGRVSPRCSSPTSSCPARTWSASSTAAGRSRRDRSRTSAAGLWVESVARLRADGRRPRRAGATQPGRDRRPGHPAQDRGDRTSSRRACGRSATRVSRRSRRARRRPSTAT